MPEAPPPPLEPPPNELLPEEEDDRLADSIGIVRMAVWAKSQLAQVVLRSFRPFEIRVAASNVSS